MPAAIPAVFAAVAAYATGATVLGLTVLQTAIVIGVGSFAVNTLGQALAPKPKKPGAYSSSVPAVTSPVINTSQTQQIKQPITDRKILYGEAQISGSVVYFTTTGSNQYFHYVIALGTHEFDSIDTVWFDQNPIYTSDLDGSGNVVSGMFSGQARIKKHLGTDAQAVDPDLLAECPEVTSNFKGGGIPYLYVRLIKNTTLYASGAPNVSAWCRGKKVYDPRSGLTLWNPNPALCIRDYLTNTRYGRSVLTNKIDDTAGNACANSCDEMVNTRAVAHIVSSVDTSGDKITLTTALLNFQTGDRVQVTSDGSIPSGLSAVTNYFVIVVNNQGTLIIQLASSYANALARTAINITSAGSGNITITKNAEPRYTANGQFGTATSPADIVNAFKTSMAGDLLNIGGLWTPKAGVYVAPTIHFNENALVGPLDVQTKHSRRERYNQVQGLYTSPLNKDQTSDYPLVSDATYVLEDKNQPSLAQLDLPLTTRPQMAQRIARIQLNRHRRQRTAQGTWNISAMQVQCGDTLYLSHANRSYVNKIFEVSDWSLVARKVKNAVALTVDMILNETDSAIYDFDESTQEILPQPVQAASVVNPNFVDPPGVPSVSNTTYNTTKGSGVKAKATVNYAASPNAFVNRYQTEFKLTTDSTYIVLSPSSDLSVTLPDITPGDYNIRVKAINIFNKESTYAAGVFTINSLTGPADMTNFSIVSLSDDATMSWDQSPDLDVKNAGFVKIRHTPDTSTPAWPNGRQLIPALPGIATQAHVPMLPGTYMAKFVDSAGNESLNAATVVLTATQIFNLNLSSTLTDQTSFSGTKTNMTVASSVLRLTTTAGVQATSGSYLSSTYIDAGKVTKCWVTTHLLMISYDSTNAFDSRAGNFDDASGLFDGTEISGVSAQIYISTTNDDPAGSPTWSAYMPFAAGYFTARAYRWKLVVTSTNSSYQLDVQELSFSVYIPDVHDTVTGATTAVVLATMNYNNTYTNIPNLMGLILDAQAGDELVIPAANITSTNFKIGVLNLAAYVVRNVVVFVKGS